MTLHRVRDTGYEIAMIDHVSVAVRDLEPATRFYEAVLGTIGYTKLETRPATVGFGKKYPEFWINLRAAMAPVADDSGAHVGLRVRTTELVDAFHAAALAAGGSSDGTPGLRPHHGEGYYAAFIRDPDGNRIEAVTFVQGQR
jgi:catechol 2,3-dioxygenase-like lactoylglutathione lyase family enzyme